MNTARQAKSSRTVPRTPVAASPADPLLFDLPRSLVAHEPAEARGLARDEVRLLVSDAADDSIHHATARDLPSYLAAGDLLVVNASATINAALDAWHPGIGGAPDERIAVHLSSPVPSARDDRHWVIELRRLTDDGTHPLLDAHAGEHVRLHGGGAVTLVTPFVPAGFVAPPNGNVRLWVAELACPDGVLAYAAGHGRPIRYSYVHERWPLAAYQTIFASEPGSAEMPSAGRPFTHDLVARLNASGVSIASLVLHAGVASLETGEPPYPERFRVPVETADAVMATHARGGRIVAVGTTVVRALETAVTPAGRVRASEGWTSLVVTPERGVRIVDAMLTGFHEPRASHLAMLEAIASRRHLGLAYRAALRERYLWHEFGDVHLIVNRASAAQRGKSW